jgi:hypothetical protein
LVDNRLATSRPRSPPVWKPVPLSQSVFTPSVVKTNGHHGHADQTSIRLRPFVQWIYGAVAEYSAVFSLH